MLHRREVAKLIDDCAVKMNVSVLETFSILCCSDPTGEVHDPDKCLENFQKGYPTPEWFVSAAIDILADRVSLIYVQRKNLGKEGSKSPQA